jgi:hypothetical protein
MPKKTLEVIAATLLSVKPAPGYFGSEVRIDQWTDTVRNFADNCALTNPNFKRERFYRACGMEG